MMLGLSLAGGLVLAAERQVVNVQGQVMTGDQQQQDSGRVMYIVSGQGMATIDGEQVPFDQARSSTSRTASLTASRPRRKGASSPSRWKGSSSLGPGAAAITPTAGLCARPSTPESPPHRRGISHQRGALAPCGRNLGLTSLLGLAGGGAMVDDPITLACGALVHLYVPVESCHTVLWRNITVRP